MYCAIQEVILKKQNTNGYPKELISEFMKMSINGIDHSRYTHRYSEERFERPIKKAYKISIHKSYRESGKIRKLQFSICTVNYYDFATGMFEYYDFCDRKINTVSEALNVTTEQLYDLIQSKVEPLQEKIIDEFMQTEEYLTHMEHEEITTRHAANKVQFNHKYHCDKYDQVYDVFGNVMNEDLLNQIIMDFKFNQEYEERSRSYQEQFNGNYKYNYNSGYSETIPSNHTHEEKETLKQFYRLLSKKYHPDANPDRDTSKEMQLINHLKAEWGI